MISSNVNDERFMREALREADAAASEGEVPVGCVIVKDDRIIARGHNTREAGQSVFDHAEITAMQKACETLGTWRLEGCTLYVTLEPCPMCAGAMIQSRLTRLVYGTKEPKFGAHGSVVNLFSFPFNHHVEVTSDVLADIAADKMRAFFRELRSKND
jgi:tRNA(adenine34) deaminase